MLPRGGESRRGPRLRGGRALTARLAQLFDRGVEMEVGVQTDPFVDRPATPPYVPAKTGRDAATQIDPGDVSAAPRGPHVAGVPLTVAPPQLFDFDLEVQPILEVLVGKTAEQALAEVAQEEELAALREQQRRYGELRDAERAERQRLAAQDRRLDGEKERRVAQARVAQLAAGEARERAAAAVLVQGYVADLLPAVLAGLRDEGYLLRRVERGVDDEFMPWLVAEVSHEIESIITSRDVLAGAAARRSPLRRPRGAFTPPCVRRDRPRRGGGPRRAVPRRRRARGRARRAGAVRDAGVAARRRGRGGG